MYTIVLARKKKAILNWEINIIFVGTKPAEPQ